MIYRKPRYCQSQESVERANQGLEEMIVLWMAGNNNNNCSEGLPIQPIFKKFSILRWDQRKSPRSGGRGHPQKGALFIMDVSDGTRYPRNRRRPRNETTETNPSLVIAHEKTTKTKKYCNSNKQPFPGTPS